MISQYPAISTVSHFRFPTFVLQAFAGARCSGLFGRLAAASIAHAQTNSPPITGSPRRMVGNLLRLCPRRDDLRTHRPPEPSGRDLGSLETARDRDRSIRANLQKFREGRDAAQRRTAVAEWTAVIPACDWLATRDEIVPQPPLGGERVTMRTVIDNIARCRSRLDNANILPATRNGTHNRFKYFGSARRLSLDIRWRSIGTPL